MKDTRDSQLGATLSVKFLCMAVWPKGYIFVAIIIVNVQKTDTSITLSKRALLLAWGLSLKISTLSPAQGQREKRNKHTLKAYDPFSMFGGRGS